MNSIQTIEFDISGQICPSTLLISLREINRNIIALKSGKVRLLFKTDNRDCTNTIPETARNMGLNACVQKIDGSYFINVTGD